MTGDQVESDWLTLSIPSGAAIYLRVFQNCTTRVAYYTTENASVPNFPAAVASMELGTSLTDKTMGGTIAQSNATQAFFPLAILGDTTKPSVLIAASDSISRGANDSIDTTTGCVGYIERAIGNSFGIVNAGSYGDFINNFNSGGTRRAALQQYASHVFVEGGCNDANGGTAPSLATLEGYRTTAYGTFSGKRVYGLTITPRTSSTDSWATATNQTAVKTADNPGGLIGQFNAWVKTNPSGQLGYFDALPALFDGNNKWLTDGTANKNTADGIHPSNVAAIAAAAQISSAVQSINRTGL